MMKTKKREFSPHHLHPQFLLLLPLLLEECPLLHRVNLVAWGFAKSWPVTKTVSVSSRLRDTGYPVTHLIGVSRSRLQLRVRMGDSGTPP